MNLPNYKTKIVCTIGPSSRTPSMIEKLIQDGMSVARLNFSHSDFKDHRENIINIRRASQKLNKPVGILVDLPGVKIRIGRLKDGELFLKRGDKITLTTKNVLGTASLISVSFKNLPKSVSVGGIIYLNDGFIQLKVERIHGANVDCRVLIEGKILSFKGLNLPGAKLAINPITGRDLASIKFCLEQGVTIFGLSFVQQAKDITKVRDYAKKLGKSVYLVAKIERREAIDNFFEILKVADAVMIARGDLGIEIPMEEVPVVQKMLIRQANLKGKAVITATQMLASMTQNIRPTRAEVNDVANAILDGTDAVMLSEETAIGNYPDEVVKTMARIAVATEHLKHDVTLADQLREELLNNPTRHDHAIPNTISLNTVRAVEKLNAKFVITQTHSGSTARHISRFKPACWILSFSHQKSVCEFLTLSYGVYPVLLKERIKNQPAESLKFIKKFHLVKKGDIVIITERRFSSSPGQTDSLGIVNI